MIYVNDKKSAFCKGDFRPAEFYKGDRKIAGYKREAFGQEREIALEGCYNDRLYNACIFGNSVQDSAPTPDNPVEIRSVGILMTEGEHKGKYKIPIITGNTKNLFDKNNMRFYTGYINTEKAQFSYATDASSVIIECQPDTTYTISHYCENVAIFRACYIKNKPSSATQYFNDLPAYEIDYANTPVKKSLTVTTGEDCKYLVIQIGTANFKDAVNTLWVEKGGNLFDKYNVNFRAAYINAEEEGYSKVSDSSSVLIKCKPYTTYTISHYCENARIFRACYIDGEPPAEEYFWMSAYNVVFAGTPEEKTLTLTTGKNCSYIAVQISTADFNDVVNTLSVEEIDSAMEPQIINIYLDEPLRKVPDASDYIDFEKGVVVRKLKVRTFAGDEAWTRGSFRLFAYVNENSAAQSAKVLCLCNRFKEYSWEELYKNSYLSNKAIGVAIQSGGVINFTPAQEIPTVEEWKAQLKAWNDEGKPLTVICFCDKAEEEVVDLPELPTFRGTTCYEILANISTTINGEYKRMEVEI